MYLSSVISRTLLAFKAFFGWELAVFDCRGHGRRHQVAGQRGAWQCRAHFEARRISRRGQSLGVLASNAMEIDPDVLKKL